jgi:MFS transporter, AAHS family, 3-hydroxyphenylpropionic acid transporter
MAIAIEQSQLKTSAIMPITICFIISCLEGFGLQAAGIAAPKLASELAMTAKLLGIFFAIATLGIIIGSSLGGRLSDRIGRKPVLLASVAIFGAASIVCGLTHDITVLLTARLVIGFGLGAALPNLIAIAAASAAPHRRNQTVTFIHSGLAVGIAAAALFAWLLPSDAWRAVFVTGGLAPLVVLPLIWLFVAEPAMKTETAPKVSVKQALFGEGRGALTLMLWLAFIFALLIAAVMVYWLPTLMVASGLTPHDAFAVQIGFGVAGAVGSLLTGALMDRFSRQGGILGIFGLTAVAYLIMSAGSSAFVVAVSMGAVIGVLTSAAQACVYALAPAVYPETFRGTGVGAAVAVGRVGTVLGPLFAGALVAVGYSSSIVLASMIPVAIVAGAFAVFVAARLERQLAKA